TERIASLLRFTNGHVIVDLAGRLGPHSLALLKASDAVLVVVDDSNLGLTAIRSLLSAFVQQQQMQNIFMVGSGVKLPMHELAENAQILDLLPEHALELPPIPFDPAAVEWAGQGKTLYSLGKRNTIRALDELIRKLDAYTNRKVVQLPRAAAAP